MKKAILLCSGVILVLLVSCCYAVADSPLTIAKNDTASIEIDWEISPVSFVSEFGGNYKACKARFASFPIYQTEKDQAFYTKSYGVQSLSFQSFDFPMDKCESATFLFSYKYDNRGCSSDSSDAQLYLIQLHYDSYLLR